MEMENRTSKNLNEEMKVLSQYRIAGWFGYIVSRQSPTTGLFGNAKATRRR
jgi:hypothetical protein